MEAASLTTLVSYGGSVKQLPLSFDELSSTLCVQCSMDYLEECDSGTIERLGKQSGFLLRTYQVELAKDPASRGTESSRSNMIALWHTIRQIYGKVVARDVANFVYANTKRQSKTPVFSSNP